MKYLLLTAMMLIVSNSMAASDLYECNPPEDTNDWVVVLDLSAGSAEFFDNDKWAQGSQVQPSNPSQALRFQSTNPKDPWTFEMEKNEVADGYLPGVLKLGKNSESVHPMICHEIQDDQD